MRLSFINDFYDREPKLLDVGIDVIVDDLTSFKRKHTTYGTYHRWKRQHDELREQVRLERLAGNVDTAKELAKERDRVFRLIEDVKNGHAFLPYVYHTPKRGKDNIALQTLVVLDIDSGLTIDQADAVLDGYDRVTYSSISSRPGSPRFRVVLFPERELTVPEAVELTRRIDARFPSLNPPEKETQAIDPVGVKGEQLYFLPGWLAEHPEEPVAVHHLGARVPVDAFPLREADQARLTVRAQGRVADRAKRVEQQLQAERSGLAGPGLVREKRMEKGVLVEKVYLSLDHELETDRGYIRFGDVSGHIGGIVCPAHVDAHGSEFADVNKAGTPYLHCHSCGTLWPPPEKGLKLKRKVPTTQPLLDADDDPIEQREEVVLPEPREFSLPLPWEKRVPIITTFLTTAIHHAVSLLLTPEGWGKSTVLTRGVLALGRSVLFCCPSHVQAAAKVTDFADHGAAHAWSLGGLLKQRHGIAAVMTSRDGDDDDAYTDIPATIEKVADALQLPLDEADALVQGLREEAAESCRSTTPVLVTSFHTGSRLASRPGFNRVVIVDDPNRDTLRGATVALENGTWLVKHQRAPEDLLFAKVPPHLPLIFTTTEVGVEERLRHLYGHSLFVHEVQELLETEDHLFLADTLLAHSKTRPALAGMAKVIAVEEKADLLFIADATQSRHNHANTKGRNDLTGDTVTAISWPPAVAAATLAADIGLDPNDDGVVEELRTLIAVDQFNQTVGRSMGYRHQPGVHTLVLCAPRLRNALLNRGRYRCTQVDRLVKRRSPIKGLPVVRSTLVYEHSLPDWLFAWPRHLLVWETWVKEFPGVDGKKRLLEVVTAAAQDPTVDRHRNWELLQRYVADGPLRWKEVAEHLDGASDDRRTYRVRFHELVAKEEKIYTGAVARARRKELNAKLNAKLNAVTNKGRLTGMAHFAKPGVKTRKKAVPGSVKAVQLALDGWLLVREG